MLLPAPGDRRACMKILCKYPNCTVYFDRTQSGKRDRCDIHRGLCRGHPANVHDPKCLNKNGVPCKVGDRQIRSRYCEAKKSRDKYWANRERCLASRVASECPVCDVKLSIDSPAWSKYCSIDCANLANRVKRYGITIQKYKHILAAQNGVCGNPLCGSSDNLMIDHDHECCPPGEHRRMRSACGKCVRGILCRSCNYAEGYLIGDPMRAFGLASYIAIRSAQ